MPSRRVYKKKFARNRLVRSIYASDDLLLYTCYFLVARSFSALKCYERGRLEKEELPLIAFLNARSSRIIVRVPRFLLY